MTGILNILAGALGVAKDTYFNLVSLLLPGNGTNGANNNEFLDGSSNTFTITRNGNTTQGTFSPFSQTGWGAYFDGSGDSLRTSDNAAFDLSSGAFTLEAFIYLTQYNNYGVVAGQFQGGTAGLAYALRQENTGKLQFTYSTNGSTETTITSSSNIPLNSWVHVCIVRDGSNNWGLFMNGTREATSTAVATIYNSTFVFQIGAGGSSSPAGDYTYGYISNLRLVKGSAVYSPTSSTLSVPTSPLTNITNTSILTCQSNRFKDNSSNDFTITPAGNVAVTPFSPFAPTQSYSASAVGGSGYFDGTGDYLTASGNSAFDLGSGDFTIEAWIYTQGSGTRRFVDYANGTAANSNFSFFMSATSGNVAYGGVAIGSTIYSVTGTTTVTNAWTHVALVRNGTASGNLKLYVNGVAEGTAASLGSNAINTLTGTPYLSISSYYNGAGEFFNGYVSSARIIKGTALYTANFTPSTAPFTAVSGTSILLNFTNAGVVDATAKNVLETVGTAQISTSVSKFGGGSIYINGSGNRAVVPNVPNAALLDFGSGDVTIECWVYPTTTSTTRAILTASNSAGTTGYYFYINSSNFVDFEVPSQAIIANNNAVSANTWTHIAFTRASGTNRLFVNGNLCTTSSNNLTNVISASGNPLRIGDSAVTGYEFPFTGYIDDLRITKGFARYTAAFTPPSAPFPVQ